MSGEKLTLPFRRGGRDFRVEAEVGVNDDPDALGCAPFAVGFPWCRATIEPLARGYGEWLGWIQLLDWDLAWSDGFRNDYFMPLGDASHPFCFSGFSPTLFDAPHTDVARETSTFLAHAFLCGLGPEPLAMRKEADAVLGFSWGFTSRGKQIEIAPPRPLGPEAWDGHLAYLGEHYLSWTFLPGFAA